MDTQMKAKLILNIVCGETTCASEPGKFCKFVRTQRFGTENVCHIFSEAKSTLEEKDGWIQRHKECLKTAKPLEEL